MEKIIVNSNVNFVDENNIFVGIDNDQYCCETFEINVLNENGQEVSEEKLKEYNFLIDGNPIECWGDFDNKKIKHFVKMLVNRSEASDCYAVFKATNGKGFIYICLVNIHNGYYGHEYLMKNSDGEVIAKNVL